MKSEIIKFLEENIDGNFTDINLSDVSVALTPRARETKTKINKWDCIKPKIFCTAKEMVIKTKRQPLNRRRYLQIIYLIKVNMQNIF